VNTDKEGGIYTYFRTVFQFFAIFLSFLAHNRQNLYKIQCKVR